MSKAVRAAMLKASVGNVKACLSLDEGEGVVWTLTPVADVHNVLDELERLQVVEERIREQIGKLETKRGLALGYSKDLRSAWEIERALVWEGKANKYLDKINLLKEVLGDS